MKVSFIEPCCAEKQLPLLLREQSFVPFQTNGDVTFEHFIKALSCLAGNEITIILATPSINVDMLRVLAWLSRRGWLKELHIATASDQAQLVRTELAELKETLHCYHHERIAESMLIIEGETASVVLQGYLSMEVTPAHRFYYALLTTSGSAHFAQLTTTLHSFFKKEDIATADAPAEQTNSTEEQSQKGGVEEQSASQEEQSATQVEQPTTKEEQSTTQEEQSATQEEQSADATQEGESNEQTKTQKVKKNPTSTSK